MELARIETRQNEERLRDEKEIVAAEADLDCERAASEDVADADVKHIKTEEHHLKVKCIIKMIYLLMIVNL